MDDVYQLAHGADHGLVLGLPILEFLLDSCSRRMPGRATWYWDIPASPALLLANRQTSQPQISGSLVCTLALACSGSPATRPRPRRGSIECFSIVSAGRGLFLRRCVQLTDLPLLAQGNHPGRQHHPACRDASLDERFLRLLTHRGGCNWELGGSLPSDAAGLKQKGGRGKGFLCFWFKDLNLQHVCCL